VPPVGLVNNSFLFCGTLISSKSSDSEKGDLQITKEHIDNNLAVRKMLQDRGVRPEQLPPSEDIKKVERRLESDEKKILKEVKKNQEKNKKK
jgi:DNA-damage-inducible protein D